LEALEDRFLPSTYATVILGDHPAAYYRLGEASGTTAFDSSGNSHDGTYLGGPTLGQPGALAGDPDTSVQFNGVDYHTGSIVDTNYTPSDVSFTVEAWVRPTAAIAQEWVIAGRSGWGGLAYNAWDGRSQPVHATAGYAGISIFDGSAFDVTLSTAVLPLNQWTYLAGTWDNSTESLDLYVNGILNHQETFPGKTSVVNAPLATFQIGAFDETLHVGAGSYKAEFFQGGIDEVAYYSVALTSTQVQQHYKAGIQLQSLQLSGFPSPTTAGVAQSFTVTALDPYGNVASGYTGTIHFTSTDKKAVLPANYTFTSTDAGVHTFSATLKTAGTQAITAKDTVKGTITGSELGIIVNPAAANHLAVSTPISSTAGTAFSIMVTALDPYGNTASGYTGTDHFSSTDKKAALPADYTFVAADAGVHTFKMALVTAGSQTITATDTVTATITGKSSTIKVSAAALNHLKVKAVSPTTAGVAFSITVVAQDAYNNTVTTYTGTVHFTSSDIQAILPADYIFTSTNKGVHTFSNGVTLKTAGTQSITATDTVTGSVTGRASIVVKPGKASTLGISAPASVTQGVAFTFTVTALDAYGNVATGYVGTVHFSSSDAAASLPANFTFLSSDGGVEAFSAILNTTGSQSLTATDTVTSSITGTDPSIQVNAGAAAVRQGSTTSLLSALSATDLAGRIAGILEKGADNYPS
jgi:hypothetical protein